MQKKFIENLIFLIIINLLVKPFWIFGIDRAVQVTVTDHEYGFYFSLFNFSFIFQIILDFGITSFNNRNIAQHHKQLRKFFSSIISFKILLALVYFLILFLTGFIIGYSGRAIHLLIFLALNQVLASYILYLRSNINALQFFKLDGLFSIMDRIFMIILCSLALWGNILKQQFRIEWFVYIQTISYSITAIVAFITVYRKAGFFRFRFNKNFFIIIVKNTWPFAVLALLMSLYTRIDGVMIERLLPHKDPVTNIIQGEHEAGIYAQGYRILDAANMFAFLFATLLLPIFSRMLKQKESVVEMVKTSYPLFFFPAFLLVSSCFFYREEILKLLYHQTSPYNCQVFGFLMVNFLAIGSVYIFGTLLTANGSLKFLNSISLFGVILNIILNFFLIRRYFAFGAVISTLVTQFLMCLIQIIKAVQLFKIKSGWKYISKSLLYIILVPIIFYFLYPLKNYHHSWVFPMGMSILISILLLLVLKLMKFRKLLRELKAESI